MNKLLLFISLVGTISAKDVSHEWESFLQEKYTPEVKTADSYRNYTTEAPESVQQFYHDNHINQTLAFVLKKKATYSSLDKAQMSIWDVMDYLDSLVDESDPDLGLPQSIHAYQTAEALRKDGHPRWLILTGFIHDLGKVLAKFGEPQWAVVGDIYPVGCKPHKKVVYSEYFADNPDSDSPLYHSKYGIYKPGCGFRNVHFSWGHDHYLYTVLKDHLPEQALYIIRYHSFYAAHREGAYTYLMDDYDKEMIKWLTLFSQYDLYSKDPESFDVAFLRPYYEELVAEFLPETLRW